MIEPTWVRFVSRKPRTTNLFWRSRDSRAMQTGPRQTHQQITLYRSTLEERIKKEAPDIKTWQASNLEATTSQGVYWPHLEENIWQGQLSQDSGTWQWGATKHDCPFCSWTSSRNTPWGLDYWIWLVRISTRFHGLKIKGHTCMYIFVCSLIRGLLGIPLTQKNNDLETMLNPRPGKPNNNKEKPLHWKLCSILKPGHLHILLLIPFFWYLLFGCFIMHLLVFSIKVAYNVCCIEIIVGTIIVPIYLLYKKAVQFHSG